MSESRIQFGLGWVLGWVAAVALILGAGKLVLIRSGWPVEVVKGELFPLGAVVGTYNALFALLIVVSVWWGRRWYRLVPQVLLALILVGAAACSQSVVLRTWCSTDGNVEPLAWLVQAGFQALYLLVTLVPIRLRGYNR
jgi:hypothetical protein